VQVHAATNISGPDSAEASQPYSVLLHKFSYEAVIYSKRIDSVAVPENIIDALQPNAV